MAQQTRTLVVIRHAKSDWNTGQPDIDRPLNGRGRRDASAIGRWLTQEGLQPDAALVSPAARTRATWEGLAEQAHLSVEPEYVRGIYLGEVDDLAEAVAELPDSSRCAVLVGHSPGCHELVEWITDGRGDREALVLMRTKFPTAAVAVVGLRGAWADVAAGCGTLERFEVCRG